MECCVLAPALAHVWTWKNVMNSDTKCWKSYFLRRIRHTHTRSIFAKLVNEDGRKFGEKTKNRNRGLQEHSGAFHIFVMRFALIRFSWDFSSSGTNYTCCTNRVQLLVSHQVHYFSLKFSTRNPRSRRILISIQFSHWHLTSLSQWK